MENSNIKELLLYSKKIKTGSSIFIIPENLDLKTINNISLENKYKIIHIEDFKSLKNENSLDLNDKDTLKKILCSNISITSHNSNNINTDFSSSNSNDNILNNYKNINLNYDNDKINVCNYLNKVECNLNDNDNNHCKHLNEYCEILKKVLNNLEIKWDWANKTFLSNLSHQLKTPLTGILTGIQILDARLKHNYDRHIVESLFKSCLELSTYISDISEYYFISHNDIEASYTKFDIKNIITQIINIFDLQLETNKTSFIKDIDNENINNNNIYQDKDKIFKILYNLINNSVKFTYNGKIKLEINVSSDSSKYYFRLLDTGKKINDEDKINIFEPFYQTNSQWTTTQDGMGLGLSICHKIIDSLSGNIYFTESQNEFINCVEFWVPIQKNNISENINDGNNNKYSYLNKINKLDEQIKNDINKINKEFIKRNVSQNLELEKNNNKKEKNNNKEELIINSAKEFNKRKRQLPKLPISNTNVYELTNNTNTIKKNNTINNTNNNTIKNTYSHKNENKNDTKNENENDNKNDNEKIKRKEKKKVLKILIIEDHKLNSNLICLMIKELIGNFHKIDILNNSIYAINKITQNSYDFILLDLKMPQVSGFDILKKLKELNFNMKTTKIIIITALICQTVSNLMNEYPDIDIIYKPIQGIDLKEKLIKK